MVNCHRSRTSFSSVVRQNIYGLLFWALVARYIHCRVSTLRRRDVHVTMQCTRQQTSLTVTQRSLSHGCAAVTTATSVSVRKKMEFWPVVKIKHLNRLSQHLSQLIMSSSRHYKPSLVLKIHSRRTSRQIGEMSLSYEFVFFLNHAQRSDHLMDFDAEWLKMRRITQGCAFMG